jgi:sulfite reductase (NADPH) flavoprotein alpha-component
MPLWPPEDWIMISPVIPENAPFSLEQRSWLNGFLAGMQNVGLIQNGHPTGINGTTLLNGATQGLENGQAAGVVTTATASKATAQVLVLYGSQSGNAEGLAHQLAFKLQSAEGSVTLVPRVLGMDAFADLDLSAEKLVLMVCSTWGDGDMPDHAVAFWNFLQSDKAPKMPQTSFAVFGLGDRNYRRFCQSGKNLDGRFEALEAKRLLPLVACDTDFEGAAQAWFEEVSVAAMGIASKGTVQVTEATATQGSGSQSAAKPAASGGPEAAGSAASAYSRKNPFPAALIENHPLNAKGSSKDTRHLSFSLLGSGLQYKVGDALGVVPRNDYNLVDRMILRLNAFGSEAISLAKDPATLRQALLEKLDLRRASTALLQAVLNGSKNAGERRRLGGLLAQPEAETTTDYLAARDVLDVLEDFKHSHPDVQEVVASLGKLAPRLYSIASSPLENPGEVHLCVGIQRMMAHGRMRRGVASTYLAERVPLGVPVPVYVQPTSHFTVPAQPGVPIIMVGPGTGVAPFRAFLQERRATGDKGKNWLFFGDQRRAYDFLYSEEFVDMEADGFLNKLSLAFSRDQEEKIYVQDRMLQEGEELYRWLEEGAYFYVCGDAKRMAKDVDTALHQIIEEVGGKTPDQARDYVERLKKEKRYGRDVY